MQAADRAVVTATMQERISEAVFAMNEAGIIDLGLQEQSLIFAPRRKPGGQFLHLLG
jgi:hypothetical protein